MTSQRGPGPLPQPLPGLPSVRKGIPAAFFFFFAFVLPVTLRNPGRSRGGPRPPGGGPWRKLQGQARSDNWRSSCLPPPSGEEIPITEQCSGAGSASAASLRVGCPPRPRAVTRHSRTLGSASSRRASPFTDLCLGLD